MGWRDAIDQVMAYILVADVSWGISVMAACNSLGVGPIQAVGLNNSTNSSSNSTVPVVPPVTNASSSSNTSLTSAPSTLGDYQTIGNFWDPAFVNIVNLTLQYDAMAVNNVNITLPVNINISSVDSLSASLVALFLNYTITTWYPFELFQFIVLPSNITSDELYNNCTNCLTSTNDTVYTVLTAWIATNSTPALNSSEFSNINTAGNLTTIGP
jgi:hypothetical protein